jgi:hypothetical protein
MRLGKSMRCALVAMGAGLLNGCVPNGAVRPAAEGVVTVKSIMQDVDGYASREYSPTMLPDQVRESIVGMDSRPVGFGRVVLDIKTESRKSGSFDVVEYTSHSTYENVGNGLMRVTDTTSANGIPVSVSVNLGYRNILMLRWQQVSLNQTYAPQIAELKSISHFDAAVSGQNLHYAYSGGYAQQVKTIDGQTNCTFGATISAADLSPRMAGTARYLDCQLLNQNGVVTTRTRYAYLDNYGFAIPLARDDATAHITFAITGFSAI